MPASLKVCTTMVQLFKTLVIFVENNLRVIRDFFFLFCVFCSSLIIFGNLSENKQTAVCWTVAFQVQPHAVSHENRTYSASFGRLFGRFVSV